MPSKEVDFRIFCANGSNCIMYNNADKESPCLIPRVISKYADWWPLVIIELWEFLYKVMSHPMKVSPNPKYFNVANSHSHSTLSKAFSWSCNRIIESRPLFSISNIISSNRRMLSPINRPLTHPFWSWWIISGNTSFKRSANTFDRIL